MERPRQPGVAPMGLGNILRNIVGYKHGTPTEFGDSRGVGRRPTTSSTVGTPSDWINWNETLTRLVEQVFLLKLKLAPAPFFFKYEDRNNRS
jgi:hypothetical protein